MKKITIPKKFIPNEHQTSIYIKDGNEYCIAKINGEIFAIDNLCPHKGASLGLGEIVGDEIICPLHQWRFNLKDGSCSVERFCIDKYEVLIED